RGGCPAGRRRWLPPPRRRDYAFCRRERIDFAQTVVMQRRTSVGDAALAERAVPPILARAKSGGAEQRLLRRGLRAPILRRSLNLAAELGRGVPTPARVIEHGAGERDHVGLAGGHAIFGLPRLRDHPDRDRGDTGHPF